MYKITYQVKTYLEMMQMGRKEWQECLHTAKPIVADIRQELKLFAETGDKTHKEKAGELKRSLPGICFQAADFELSVGTKKFNKGKKGHWREQQKAYLSGLVVIDVDHCGNPRELFERIKAQFDLKALGILLIYVSASGEGLKIVFKARAEWGNLICNQYEMAALLGILDFVDDACKDSSRLSFVTGEQGATTTCCSAIATVRPPRAIRRPRNRSGRTSRLSARNSAGRLPRAKNQGALARSKQPPRQSLPSPL